MSDETRVERRLSAVLSADIEGYSRLCGLDEAQTILAFDRLLQEHVRPVIDANKGKIVNIAGDGLLADFGSATSAVEAAMALQSGMIDRNRSVDPARRLRFRVGINLGDVVVHNDQIFGEGVNIAVRAQSMAAPDAICVTEAVFRQVEKTIAGEFRFVGEIALKNIAEPVKLYTLSEPAFLGIDEQEELHRFRNEFHSKPSLAILPFTNLSGDPKYVWFCDGFAEDLLTDLSNFHTISVIARESSFQYRGQKVDIRRVGLELGVRFVVEGSIRKLKKSARITVQLVDAASRNHIWANRYDIPMTALFEAQDEIVNHVVTSLVPRMEGAILATARRKPPDQLQAYDFYLKGKAILYEATDRESVAEARKCFEKAIAEDPAFPYPYCYLVRLLNNHSLVVAPGSDVRAAREKAWHYAKLALSLDDTDPHVHVALGWCHLWRREFDSAGHHFEIAEKLNPNDADRAMDRGTGWMFLGDVERALVSMIHRVALNPFCSTSYVEDLAEVYFVAGRYGDMVRLLNRVPQRSLMSTAWGIAGYALYGDLEVARREADRFLSAIKILWEGAPTEDARPYVQWILDLSPFAQEVHRSKLIEGLRLSGLPCPEPE